MKVLGLLGGTAACGAASYMVYSQSASQASSTMPALAAARQHSGASSTPEHQSSGLATSSSVGSGNGGSDTGPAAAVGVGSWLASPRVQDFLVGLGGVAGATGVALGAFGFHGLKSKWVVQSHRRPQMSRPYSSMPPPHVCFLVLPSSVPPHPKQTHLQAHHNNNAALIKATTAHCTWGIRCPVTMCTHFYGSTTPCACRMLRHLAAAEADKMALFWNIGKQYQLWHSGALMATAALPPQVAVPAGALFATGTKSISSLTEHKHVEQLHVLAVRATLACTGILKPNIPIAVVDTCVRRVNMCLWAVLLLMPWQIECMSTWACAGIALFSGSIYTYVVTNNKFFQYMTVRGCQPEQLRRFRCYVSMHNLI